MLILQAYYIEHTAQKLGQHLVELDIILYQWVDEIDTMTPLKMLTIETRHLEPIASYTTTYFHFRCLKNATNQKPEKKLVVNVL